MSNDYDDAAFIAQLRANDFSAQVQLLRTYAPKLTALAMTFRLSREDAVEVASQSLQKVIDKIDTYEDSKGVKFSTWVFQIAKNTTIDRLRQMQREQEKSGGSLESVDGLVDAGVQIESLVSFPDSDDEDVGPQDIEHEILNQAFENLSSIEQEVLSRWVYGNSFKEIGQLIGKKEGTAKVTKYRALIKLREKYLTIAASQDNEAREALKARYKSIRRELQ